MILLAHFLKMNTPQDSGHAGCRSKTCPVAGLQRTRWSPAVLEYPDKKGPADRRALEGDKVTVFRAHFRLGSWYQACPLRRFGIKGTEGKGAPATGLSRL